MPRLGSVHWRRDPHILARLSEVERRHLAGQTNTAIGKALGVDEGTIRNDLKRLQELWVERIQGEQATMRARLTAELEDTRRRALQAAEFDEAAERAVLFDAPHPEYGEAVRDKKDSARFRGQKAQSLNVARQAVMDKAKLNGLVVEKQEISGDVTVRRYVGVAVEDV